MKMATKVAEKKATAQEASPERYLSSTGAGAGISTGAARSAGASTGSGSSAAVSTGASAGSGSASDYRAVDFRKPMVRFCGQDRSESHHVQDFPVFNGKYSTTCYVDEVLAAARSMFARLETADGQAAGTRVDLLAHVVDHAHSVEEAVEDAAEQGVGAEVALVHTAPDFLREEASHSIPQDRPRPPLPELLCRRQRDTELEQPSIEERIARLKRMGGSDLVQQLQCVRE